MKLLYTVVVTLTFTAMQGQERTYFDEKWKETDKQNAKYYRIAEKKDSLYAVKDYYINNVLQFEGYSKSTEEPLVLEGTAKWYNSEGKVITNAILLHNKRNGDYNEFYDTGAPKVSGHFVDGQAKGTYIEYYPTGQIANIADFVMNKINGPHLKYDFNGNIDLKLNYVNGVLEGPYETYEHGQLQSKGNTLHGVQEGECFYYNNNGSIRIKYNVNNGFLNGPYHEYDSDGKVLTDAEFKDGKALGYKSKREGPINDSYFSNEMTLKNNVECWKLLRDGIVIIDYFYKEGFKSGIWKIYSTNGKKLMITKDYTKANCESESYLQKTSEKFTPFVNLSDRFTFGYNIFKNVEIKDRECTEAIIKNMSGDEDYNPLFGYKEKIIGDISDEAITDKPISYTEPAAQSAFLSKNNCQQGYKQDDKITVCTRTFGKVTYKMFASEDVKKLKKLQQEERPSETEIYFYYQKYEERDYTRNEIPYNRYMGFALPKGIIEIIQISDSSKNNIIYTLEHTFFNVSDFMGSSAMEALEKVVEE